MSLVRHKVVRTRGHAVASRADAAQVMSAPRPPEPVDRPRRGEAGVTVVEMLAAVFVLAIGVMSVSALLVTSARTAAIAEAQSDASALATGELEILRSYDYALIGIDPSSEGYAPSFEDRPTVTEEDGNLVQAQDKVEVDDTVYGITRSVTWATVGENREAYKIVRIDVSWESRAGSRSVTVQTGLHEGLFGV